MLFYIKHVSLTSHSTYITDSIDAKDPLTGETTNLSIFSSWLNFSWMAVRFKEGVEDGTRSRSRTLNEGLDGEWKHSRYAVSLFRDLYHALVSDTYDTRFGYLVCHFMSTI